MAGEEFSQEPAEFPKVRPGFGAMVLGAVLLENAPERRAPEGPLTKDQAALYAIVAQMLAKSGVLTRNVVVTEE